MCLEMLNSLTSCGAPREDHARRCNAFTHHCCPAQKGGPCPPACSATRVGDGCWAALAQLPQLEWLDLSDTRLTVGTLHEGGRREAASTSTCAFNELLQRASSGAARGVLLNTLSLLSSPCTGGHEFAALTYLNLNSSQLENRGCRQLAASLPQLRELWLGSKAVDDKGLRALCRLPRVRRRLVRLTGTDLFYRLRLLVVALHRARSRALWCH